MSKILFLDFDGVIRLALEMKWNGEKSMKFCSTRIAMLAGVCHRTGCKVVLSTDWRFDEETDPRSNLGPLQPFLHEDWRTPCKGARWKEIEHWIDAHPETEDFAILDDLGVLFDGAPESITKRLMLCCSRYGLTPSHISKLINQFNDTKPTPDT